MARKLRGHIPKRYDFAAADADTAVCEWLGCHEAGTYRAPKSPLQPDANRWFCKHHAGRYNKAWNFFTHMSEAQVEDQVRRDAVWNRPSWPLGGAAGGIANGAAGGIADGVAAMRAFIRGRFDDPLGAFGYNSDSHDTRPDPAPAPVPADVRQALIVLDLPAPADLAAVKTRYKQLAKRHHPDATPDSTPSSDDRIKEINQAYQVVVSFLSA